MECDGPDRMQMVNLMDRTVAPEADAEDDAPKEADPSERGAQDAVVGEAQSLLPSAEEPGEAGWLRCLDVDPVRAEQLYRDYRRDLTRFLEWQHDDAEAAAHEALIRGLRSIARGADTSRAGVRAYLFGFAKNLAKEGWKIRKRERPLDDDAAARRPSASRGHAQVEARLMLRDVLGQLTAADRRIIIRYCTETDHTAHCRELGVTPMNLRVIVHRIRVGIRKQAEAGSAGRRK